MGGGVTKEPPLGFPLLPPKLVGAKRTKSVPSQGALAVRS